MLHVVKPVDPKLLIEANDAVSAQRGKGDATFTMIAHFDNRLEADDLLAISYRLQALASLIQKGEGPAWVIHSKGKEYKLVNEAMFRAAAITPLSIEEDQLMANLAFDTDAFLENALAESDTTGSA